MGKIEKEWHEESALKSHIENLVFLADRRWKNVKVNMRIAGGRLKATLMTADSEKCRGEKEISETFGNEYGDFSYTVNKECSFYVDGFAEGVIFPTANATVRVEAEFDDASVLKSESSSWSDSPPGVSYIDNLYLPDTQYWVRASVQIDMGSNKDTGCLITFFKNGEFAYTMIDSKNVLPKKVASGGSGNFAFDFNINAKTSLVVGGFINNESVGGNAKITLTGFYK